MCAFSRNFSAPLLVSFTSGAAPGPGGGVLYFASAGRRRAAAAAAAPPASESVTAVQSMERAGPARPGHGRILMQWQQISEGVEAASWARPARGARAGSTQGQTAAPCTCGGAVGAVDGGDCSSPFFESATCAQATATWPWLGFHTAASVPTVPPTTVDAVIYFERFRNFNTKDWLYVTAAFAIYTPNLAHPMDVIALFKGPDGDGGSCDAARSLASCGRYSPLSSPPTLVRQLCWAYTSALGPQGADTSVPGATAADAGSVNFCSDVTESAGDGAYYALLYSFILKKVIAQVSRLVPSRPRIASVAAFRYTVLGPSFLKCGWIANAYQNGRVAASL